MTNKTCKDCHREANYLVRVMSPVGYRDLCQSCIDSRYKQKQESPRFFFKDYRPKFMQVTK